MKRLTVLTVIFIALAIYVLAATVITGHVYVPYYYAPSASAAWHETTRDQPQSTSLTMARATRALVAYGQADHPRSVTITGCDRLNRRAVRCWINETDVLMPFYVNGQRVIGNADWLAIATLRNGRVSTHLN